MRLPPCHGQRPPGGAGHPGAAQRWGLGSGSRPLPASPRTAAVQPCPAVTVADMPGSPVRGQWPGPRTGWQLHLVGLGLEPLQLTHPAGSATLEGPAPQYLPGHPALCPVGRLSRWACGMHLTPACASSSPQVTRTSTSATTYARTVWTKPAAYQADGAGRGATVNRRHRRRCWTGPVCTVDSFR